MLELMKRLNKSDSLYFIKKNNIKHLVQRLIMLEECPLIWF
jgi:hypothetical protein